MKVVLKLDAVGLTYLIKHSPRASYLTASKVFDGCQIVAIEGGAEDWAAYVGPFSAPQDDVARFGDKLDSHTAALLFPWLCHLSYRR